MDASDAHLEHALEEYNDTVNKLEPDGPSVDLLEAYVNRGCILAMMEYRTSAVEDLESADEIIRSMEDEGTDIDDGTFVKTYVTLGDMLFDEEADPVEAYARASLRIKNLDEHARHFDRRSIVRTCIGVIENLIDSEYPEDTEPFFARAMSLVMTANDPWSKNRYLELLNLEGEVGDQQNDPEAAAESYGRAIDVGTELLKREQMEDVENLVMSFVSKAEAEQSLDRFDDFVMDMNGAIVLLEQMLKFNRLDDTDILVSLHHDMASVLMKHGKVEDAEKHLVKAMTLEVKGASEYINSQTDREV